MQEKLLLKATKGFEAASQALAPAERRVVSREEVARLRDRLAQLKNGHAEAKQELEKALSIRNARESRLREELAVKRHTAMLVEHRVSELEARIKIGPPPPGPECLDFVDGNVFLGVASLVIVANIVHMTFEVFFYPGMNPWAFALDQAFLIFYVVEFVLKAMYFQKQLLCGPLWIVWWNWMDAIIVASGVVDRWVSPMLAQDGSSGQSYMAYLRILRLARLARLLKLVKIFMRSDLAWADGAYFQSFIMAVISFNALLMGLEAEYPQQESIWVYFEHGLLVIFSFELVLRLKKNGCQGFFANPKEFVWNWLDFVIVVGGIVDQWMLPGVNCALSVAGASDSGPAFGSSVAQVMSMLRMARLLRILRLARLIKNIPPLYKLVVGIATAMQGMAWVMLLTSMVLYICALTGVRLVGPEGVLWGDKPVPEGVDKAFPDIYGAVFNLFKVMNGDMAPMEDLYTKVPVSKLALGIFVVITNWAIFSIMTAVVSDNMARVTQATEEEDEAERTRYRNIMLVDTIFDKLGASSSGCVSSDSLRQLMGDDAAVDDLATICDIPPEDMKDLCDITLHNAAKQAGNVSSMIDKECLLKGFGSDTSTINQRSIMRINKKVDGMEGRVALGMSSLEDMVTRGAAKIRAARSP